MTLFTRIRALSAITMVGAAAACVSVGEGEGYVQSTKLVARDCWSDAYDLKPDFFAADPAVGALQIRVQRGADLLEVSDGVLILVDDVEEVRNRLGEPIEVALPEGVSPPGVPVGGLCPGGTCAGTPVHFGLYLLESCHSQNTVLYGVGGTVTFDELFSGDPDEADAAQKLTVARFDVMVADPRDAVRDDSGAYSFPQQSRVTGYLRFFFQRGQPAQPFP